MANEFSFQELISRRALAAGMVISPTSTRLIRHDTRGRKMWHRGRAEFEHWVSFQRAGSRNPYNKCALALHFIPARLPNGNPGALFVAAHEVIGQWLYEGLSADRQPTLFASDFPEDVPFTSDMDNALAVDLVRIPIFEEFSERIVIEGSSSPHGTRSWSQWWKNDKPIVEIRAAPVEDPFPGFHSFRLPVDDIEMVPATWRAVLSSVAGVYLLVCQDTGQQYVGSAHGEAGFYGRWLEYAHTGHGGNKLLKANQKQNFQVSILEVVSSTTSTSELIHREQEWKHKLGSQVFGLNAN